MAPYFQRCLTIVNVNTRSLSHGSGKDRECCASDTGVLQCVCTANYIGITPTHNALSFIIHKTLHCTVLYYAMHASFVPGSPLHM